MAVACRDKVSYKLDNQGIRVISGSNLDDDGSLSNGAGKSALVMSALWALTGRTDPRAEVRAQPTQPPEGRPHSSTSTAIQANSKEVQTSFWIAWTLNMLQLQNRGNHELRLHHPTS